MGRVSSFSVFSRGWVIFHIPDSDPEAPIRLVKSRTLYMNQNAQKNRVKYLIVKNFVQFHDVGVPFTELQSCYFFLSIGFHPAR